MELRRDGFEEWRVLLDDVLGNVQIGCYLMSCACCSHPYV